MDKNTKTKHDQHKQQTKTSPNLSKSNHQLNTHANLGVPSPGKLISGIFEKTTHVFSDVLGEDWIHFETLLP